MRSLALVKLMPWGGARNIELRETLGLRDGEVGLVDRSYRVQLVVDSFERAQSLALDLDEPQVFQRPDGRWVVWESPLND